MQPLLVFPTDTGIDIVFRKKPTSERGSTDGGLIIKVEEKSVLWDPHRVPGATRARGLEGARPSAETAAADAVKMPRGRKGGEDLYDVPRATVAVLCCSLALSVSLSLCLSVSLSRLLARSGARALARALSTHNQVKCMHTCMLEYIHTCLHTYMLTCMHTYIYTYIHTHIQAYEEPLARAKQPYD